MSGRSPSQFEEKKQNVPKPSGHPPVRMSKRLGRIKGGKYKSPPQFKRKVRARLYLLSIPQSGGKNVKTLKTFRSDHRLQIQNLFMPLSVLSQIINRALIGQALKKACLRLKRVEGDVLIAVLFESTPRRHRRKVINGPLIGQAPKKHASDWNTFE